MRMVRTSLSLSSALVLPAALAKGLAASPAVAQPASGLYMGGGLGGNYNEEQSGRLGGFEGRVQTARGWAAVGSLGWAFGNGIRADLEVSYRDNRAINLTTLNFRGASVGGAFQQTAIMGNAFYDFHLGFAPGGVSVVPYIGAGLGYAWLNYNDVGARLSPTTRALLTGTKGGFAYQAIAGVAFGLDQFVPGLALTTEYRYFATLDTRGTSRLLNNAGATVVGSNTTFSAQNSNHAVLVGLRYAFNAARPAPPPAPAAAPAPARTFLVFFDWDRADLTDRARQIIAEAANNARTVGSTRIEVQGHADRTGSAAYNQRLSVRRAEAVAAELVRRGIPRDQMSIQGFGFDRPLVPTAMGVREPQNRRVEIILR
jgi:outer membrane protein OmpA-like peptidoglycan-associated protein